MGHLLSRQHALLPDRVIMETAIHKFGLTFAGVFTKATTTVDGGWNVTFSVSQDEAKNILSLSAMRDTLLQVAVIPVEIEDEVVLDG